MYKQLTLDQIKDSQNLKDNFLWDQVFYKGIVSNEVISDYLFFNSENYFRDSATVEEHGNLYNLLINELLDWQAFPLRKKSIIFTNDFYTARGFSIPRPSKGLNNAKLFCVIPKKKSRIMVSPECDLWESFKSLFIGLGVRNHTYSLIHFNASFKALAEYYDIINYDISLENFNELIKEIYTNKKDPSIMNLPTQSIHSKIIELQDNFLTVLNNFFSPAYNNFKNIAVESHMKIEKNKELWTDEDCLLINHEKYPFIVDLLKLK